MELDHLSVEYMNNRVNSHNEWDPLEEVIVGDGFPVDLPCADFSFRYFFHDNIYGKPTNWSEPGHQYITSKHIAEHKEDLDNLAELLSSHGITVHRPKVPSTTTRVKTLQWESTNYPALNVRDLTIIIGDKIIETPPSCRWRYFENDYLKHLFLEYFKSGATWIQAPKPIITDNSFDLSRFSDPVVRSDYENSKSTFETPLDLGIEVMFDAANCMRLGRDIIFNVGNEHEKLGARWLGQVLGNQYHIHEVCVADSHIDSTFIPIRPGLALTTKPNIKDHLPTIFSDWEIIYVPIIDRTHSELDDQDVKIASPKIWINALSIDSNTIICHTQYYKFLKIALHKHNVSVIPSQIRHCELFGGAHHCVTLDIRRRGDLQDYFN